MQPNPSQVHVPGPMKKMSVKARMAELPAKIRAPFERAYHEGLGLRGASGKGATAAEAMAYAEAAMRK